MSFGYMMFYIGMALTVVSFVLLLLVIFIEIKKKQTVEDHQVALLESNRHQLNVFTASVFGDLTRYTIKDIAKSEQTKTSSADRTLVSNH